MRKLVLALTVATLVASPPSVASGDALRVSATEGWFETGIGVIAGTTYAIEANGAAITANASAFAPVKGGFGAVSGPAGQIYRCGDFESPGFTCLEPGSGFGALVGRIGAGPAFLIGASSTFFAPTTGKLSLAVNDFAGYHSDNQGGFGVSIGLAPVPIAHTAATFPTNLYFNCRPDHNIGVPEGKRLVLSLGWGAQTRGQIEAFLNGISMNATIAGVPLADPLSYWSAPYFNPAGDGLWITRWAYDTGIVSTFASSYLVDIAVAASHPITDGFETFTPEDNPIADTDGPCGVTAF